MSTPKILSLRGQLVTLRLATADDAERLTEIVTEPAVAEWWPRYDLARVRHEMSNRPDEPDEAVVFAVEADGLVIGLIQYWEQNEEDYRHAGMDIALHPAWHRRGMGADAVRVLARHLFDDHGHHRIIIDPAAHNRRAIRAYERVGFRPVGIMRRYERGADGTWHDGLLMDLLRDDLK